MSGAIGVDLGNTSWDQPVAGIQSEGVRSILSATIGGSKGRNATVGDVARFLGDSMRIVGTPEQIADRLEQWSAAGVDGFNVMYSITPGTFADFIEYVAPELQRRGLMQREYAPGTLRERLFGAGPYLPDRHIARSYRYWDFPRRNELSAIKKEAKA
jgi:long-chain alkane monooxygenase